MRTSAVALALALGAVATSCDSALQREKDRAILELSSQSPTLLEEVVLEEALIDTEQPGSETVQVEGGTILALHPIRRLENDRDTILEYPLFSAHIVKFAGGDELSSFPSTWGDDDLDKLRYLCGASQRMIDEAADSEGVGAALAVLTARATVAPFGAYERLIWVEGDRLEGLLSGDFSRAAWMEIWFRPSEAAGANYRITFRRKEGGSHRHVLEFIRSLAFEPGADTKR